MEIWKEINGCVGYYVNENGYIKSAARSKRIGFGRMQPMPERLLKTYIHCGGYKALRMVIDGKSKICFVHRILADAFIQNLENKPFVNHKNGIKTDNRIENLEWVTSSENNKHAYDTGLKIPYRKVSKEERQIIRDLKNIHGISQHEIARRYGMKQGTISQIINFRKVYANG